MSDTLKSWVAVGHHIVPADHAGRKIGGSTNPVRDYEEYAHLICRVDGKYQNDAANVRLIAASPELLLALQRALLLIEQECADGAHTTEAINARAAILKATGGAA